MDFTTPYWYWIILGLGLGILEIFLPSFIAFWFAIAALAVGLITLLIPSISLTVQIFIWTLLSGALSVAWFKYLKPLSRKKLSTRSVVGEVGQVINLPAGERPGKIRFSAPVLGADEWDFITQDEINIGDRVRVVDTSENTLVVSQA